METLLFFNADAFFTWLFTGSGPTTMVLVTGCAAWLVRGLLGDIKQRLKKMELKNTDLSSKVSKVEEQVPKVEERTTIVEKEIVELKTNQTALETRIDLRFNEFQKYVDVRFSHVDSRLEQLDSKIDKLESKFDKLESRFDKLESKFDQITFLLINQNKKTQE